MNIQQAFDTAARGVLEQGGPSWQGDGCAYLGSNGRSKCGVGHLLLDDEMRRRWDNAAWGLGAIMQEHPPQAIADLKASGLEEIPLEFLKQLQAAHDQATSASDFFASFKRAMQDIAEDWGLDPGVVS